MAIHEPEVQTYLVEFCERLKVSKLINGNLKCWAEKFKLWMDKIRNEPNLNNLMKSYVWPPQDEAEFYAYIEEWLTTNDGFNALRSR